MKKDSCRIVQLLNCKSFINLTTINFVKPCGEPLILYNYIFISSCFFYYLYYIFRSLNTLFLLVVVIWSLNVRYDIQSILLEPKIENEMVLQNTMVAKEEKILEIKCDNYVPQWWVQFNDELSWLFTKRFRAFYLICRK